MPDVAVTSVVIPAARRSRIRRRVLEWYAARGRPLAFRATSDPWAILVSEVMAQQTQAARAAEAWARFMARWPSAAALAAASPAEVLREWRGLGYNRRAIALQGSARAIVADHGGRVPHDVDALRGLPGVGPYTARAVTALAFGHRVGAVDTNVRRVIGRALLGTPTPDPAELQTLADDLVPARSPGRWTHALMDIGATLCRPRQPRCADCPLRSTCLTAQEASRLSASRLSASPRSASPRSAPPRAAVPRAAMPQREPAHEPAFRSTARWLRGRILDRLRDAPDGSWLTFADPIGRHDLGAIDRALHALAREGLVDLRTATALEARLPVA